MDIYQLIKTHYYLYLLMRGLIRLAHQHFSKKLGIAETAKVIQEKIMNITQVVTHILDVE